MIYEFDYRAAAEQLGCDVAAIKAVAEVESFGSGFSNGSPKILFEAHIFSRLTGGRYDKSHPRISSPRWNKALYGASGQNQHRRLADAVALDRDAALQSASWGRFQILGLNWQRCGYSSLQGFINAMYRDERSHLQAFVGFVKSMGLVDELQRHDWAGFARVFNGPAFAENRYDQKMAAAYKRFSKE